MKKREKVRKIKNSFYFQKDIVAEQVWEDTKEIIVDYLESEIKRIEKEENKHLKAYIDAYNHFSTCSRQGLKYFLNDIPQYLLIRIMEDALGFKKELKDN